MPKKRVIAGLFIKNGIVVQSIGFERYLPVGRPEIAARFLDSWGIDEIVLVDIDASREGRTIDADLVGRVANEICVPLTAGGGITDIQAMRALLSSGADKIAVNTSAIEQPELVGEAASVFGTQCVIASVDVRRHADGHDEVFVAGGDTPTSHAAADIAQKLEAAGAGEILLNSINRDGRRVGYDLALAETVGTSIGIPLICFGGAGHPTHIAEALACPWISAAGAANFWHYTEHSATTVKAFVGNQDLDVRIETAGTYRSFSFLEDGRIARQDDTALEDQIFEHIEEAAI